MWIGGSPPRTSARRPDVATPATRLPARTGSSHLPGWHNHDLPLFTDFRFKGNQQLQYRWEIYNLCNQVQYQDVNTTATFNPTTGAQTNSNFGKVTSARTERRMQMSLRYMF